MNPFVKFFNRMDATAWRAIIVTLLLLVGVFAALIMGRLFLFSGENDGILGQAQSVLSGLRSSPLGLVAVIVFFCVMAFVGAPQFGLIGAAVLAFGPVLGFFYAWVATMCSASLNFWLGRYFGMSLVRRYGGESINRLSRFMGRNDFLASAVVRNVPTAPFIVVNMAFGASEARYLNFLGGAMIGVVPKTLLIALFGQAVAQSLTGNPLFAVATVAIMIVLWVGLMLFARSRMATPEEPAASDGRSEG